MYSDKIILFLKKIEPVVAVAVLLFLVITSTMLYQNNKLYSKIAKDCGWSKDDWRCACEKSDVIEMENRMKNQFGGFLNISIS